MMTGSSGTLPCGSGLPGMRTCANPPDWFRCGSSSSSCGRVIGEAEAAAIGAAFLKAYRWQYIHSGAGHPQFGKVLGSLITEKQGRRIQAALQVDAVTSEQSGYEAASVLLERGLPFDAVFAASDASSR